MYTEVVKVASLKCLTMLQHLVEADDLFATGDVYVIADIALYHEARHAEV